jgi:uncharacterized protein with NRDE domain
MCTLIAIHGCVPGAPLVVAANRDEYLDRPASGPTVRWQEAGPILAPRDERAGGTWLGLNGSGVFAALTNLRVSNPDPTRRSRGEVVIEALGGTGAREAAARLGKLAANAYNPFNCFVADGQRAFVIVYREAPRITELTRGVHVIGNADADTAAAPKIGRVLERAREVALLPREQILPALAGICREHGHGESPLDDTCVHAGGTYGTRSSMLFELAERSAESRMLWADGPPCKEPYQDYSSLLHELRRASGYGAAETMARTAS